MLSVSSAGSGQTSGGWYEMIFFTTYVTIIRRNHERPERRRGSPARVEGGTIRLPIGTDVQAGDYLEHRLANDEIRNMVVIDVVPPYLPGANEADDYIEVTCIPVERVATSQAVAPVLHPAMSVAVKLFEEGRMSEAVSEAFRLVEARVQALTAREGAGRSLMESVFAARPPQLDVTTATGPAAEDERDGFQHLFIGAMLGLGRARVPDETSPGALDETFEYLAVASMLMRRLDRAESRLP
jgi:uncharacterized protein (TIGR02391 family)